MTGTDDDHRAELPNAPTTTLARTSDHSDERTSTSSRFAAPQHQPRPDQIEAIDAVEQVFASGQTRAQVVAASGTGKTLLALWIVERLRPSTVLYFAPSLALIRQTAISWFTHAEQTTPLTAIAVCSDETVADDIPRADMPFPVTTDPGAVAAFFRATEHETRRVAFATYQSVSAVAEALEHLATPPSLIICDEAHRIAGAEGKHFQIVLDARRIPGPRRLFMTATPRIVAPHRRELREGEVPVVSMDDPTRFGHVAYALPFGRAISLGLLADYRIDVLAVRDADVRALIAQLPQPRPAVGEDASELAPAAATVRAFANGTFRHAFSFHHTTKAATRFAGAVREMASETRGVRCRVGTVFGTTPVAERDTVLQEMLAAPCGVLASARALMEGIDAPSVDAVIFVDPKRSVVDIAQGIGRALRRDPRVPRKLAHVVVPVVVTDTLQDDDIEEALATSLWEPVWRVLSALAAHDDRLEQALALAAQARGRAEGNHEHGTAAQAPDADMLTVHGINIPVAAMLPPGMSVTRFSHAVRVRAVATLADPFEYGFGRLQAHVRQEVNANPVRGYVAADGFRLGEWVTAQRLAFQNGQLSDARARRLQRLRGWKWTRGVDEFDRGLRSLKRFVEERRTARVPYAHWDRSGFWLGDWAAKQRALQRERKLPPLRASFLEAVSGWRWDQADPPCAATVGVLRERTDRALFAAIASFSVHVPPEPRELLSAAVQGAEGTPWRSRPLHPVVDWLARDFAPHLLDEVGETRMAGHLRDRPALEDMDDVRGVPYWLKSASDQLMAVLAIEILMGHPHLTWSSLLDSPGRGLALPATIDEAAVRAAWNVRYEDPKLVGSADLVVLACRTIAIAAATLWAVRRVRTDTSLDARALVIQQLATKARHDQRFARLSYGERADRIVKRYLGDGTRRIELFGARAAAEAESILQDAMQRQDLVHEMRITERSYRRIGSATGGLTRGELSGETLARELEKARRSVVFGSFGPPGPIRTPARGARVRAQSDAWRSKLLASVEKRISELRGPRNRHYYLRIDVRWTALPDGVRNGIGFLLGRAPQGGARSAPREPMAPVFQLKLERTSAPSWEGKLGRKYRQTPALYCPPQAAFAMDRASRLPTLKGAVMLACVPASSVRRPKARKTFHGAWLRLDKDGTLSLEGGLVEVEHGAVALLTANELAVAYGRRTRPSAGDPSYRESSVPWSHPVVLPPQSWSESELEPDVLTATRVDENPVSVGTNASHRAIMPDGTVVMTRDERFAFNLAAAQEYAAQEHHLLPRKHEKPRGVNLYMWLQNQELRLRRGTLEPERRTALSSIPEWNARVEQRQVRPA